MKKMKKMTEELEVKKSQTDRLLFEFVPPVIAEALRAAKTVPARKSWEKFENSELPSSHGVLKLVA